MDIVRSKTHLSNATPNQERIFSDELWNEHAPTALAGGLTVGTARMIWENWVTFHYTSAWVEYPYAMFEKIVKMLHIFPLVDGRF